MAVHVSKKRPPLESEHDDRLITGRKLENKKYRHANTNKGDEGNDQPAAGEPPDTASLGRGSGLRISCSKKSDMTGLPQEYARCHCYAAREP